MSAGAAGRHLSRGRYAFAHDRSASAWAAGEIVGEHIDAMARVRSRARDDAAYAEFEPSLLDVARTGTPSDVADMGRLWLERLTALREWERAHEDDLRRAREEAEQSAAADAAARRADQAEGSEASGTQEQPDPADRRADDRSGANPFDGLLSDVSLFGFTQPVAGFS